MSTRDILILVLIVLIGGLTFLIVRVDNLRFEIAESERARKALEARITGLEDVVSDALVERGELEAAQERALATIENLSEEVGSQRSQLDELEEAEASAVVSQWAPFVYRIKCSYGDAGDAGGSAVLEEYLGGLRFISNEHVITEDGEHPTSCVLFKPGQERETELEVDGDDIVVLEEIDLGYGRISSGFASGLSVGARCEGVPDIGDRVVTLGYPRIGSKESITATEGIISGFDDPYYITSAKIEQGNSGGLAVHVEDQCFLGLPTLVFRGSIESLARILPIMPDTL